MTEATVTAAKMAEAFGVSVWTARRWARSGKLDAVKVNGAWQIQSMPLIVAAVDTARGFGTTPADRDNAMARLDVLNPEVAGWIRQQWAHTHRGQSWRKWESKVANFLHAWRVANDPKWKAAYKAPLIELVFNLPPAPKRWEIGDDVLSA